MMLIFYSENDYLNHEANNLNEQLKKFFLEIKNLPKGTHFDLKYIPDEEFKTKVRNSESKSNNDSNSLFIYIKNFFNKFLELDQSERDKLIKNYFKATEKIKEIINDANENDLEFKYDYYPKIKKETKELFNFLYENTLKSYRIKNHYSVIYKKLIENKIPRICPMCGIRDLPNPDSLKANYDHLLSQEFYPFTSVYLGNLIPCCSECNTGEKFRQDILLDRNKQRRKYKYPFSDKFEINKSVSLTVTFDNSSYSLIAKIEFGLNDEYIETWNDIYRIKGRYEEEIQNNFHSEWLENFKERLISENIKSKVELINILEKEIELWKKTPLSEKKLLMAPAFEAFKKDAQYVDIVLQQIVNS